MTMINRSGSQFSLNRIFDWFTFNDYETEKDAATARIIARQSRGNVTVQNGWFLTTKALLKKSRKADKAMQRINKAS